MNFAFLKLFIPTVVRQSSRMSITMYKELKEVDGTVKTELNRAENKLVKQIESLRFFCF